MSYYDLSKPYIRYNESVLNGDILAGKWIKLACERTKQMFNRNDIIIDYE